VSRLPRRRHPGLLLALLAAVAALASVASGCTEGGAPDDAPVSERPVRVVATTNFITDLAEVVGGERAQVTGLMGPGVDPHLYRPSAGDVTTLRRADLILYGGLDLEGRMADLFDRLAATRATVAVTRDIPEERLRSPNQFAGAFDPHVWFSVPLWIEATRTTAEAFAEVDPEHAGDYRARAEAYVAELEDLDAWVRGRIEDIPERSRVLVTSHDAFGYLGDEYGLEVVAIQGTSTQTEATTADIERVAGVVTDRGIRTVFVESSVPRQAIDAVLAAAARRGQRAEVGGELLADAAGDRGTPQGTYIGMVRHNVELIASGLG
jgi:manganese/zinc/iron transport system substrate-binding protein